MPQMPNDVYCPGCDSYDIKLLGSSAYKCYECGMYFDDDDITVQWEKSSTNRTHAKRDYDDYEHE